MLLTKTITTKWMPGTREHYEQKGYIFTKYKDEFVVNVSDLLPQSGVRVEVKCDNCGAILHTNYSCYNNYIRDGKYYCNLCSVKLYGTKNSKLAKLKKSISFEQWCIDNLSSEVAQNILLRWDYKKNQCKPSDVCFQSSGFNGKSGYWFKCIDNPEHESERKSFGVIVRDQKNILICHQCNSVYCKCPDLANLFVNIEDAKKHPLNSIIKVDMKCPCCGFIRKISIAQAYKYGFSCPVCSDGISYPNKFAFELLSQLKIKFIHEFAPDWANGKRYDFYFEYNDCKYILEMDGDWHFTDNTLSGQTKEESEAIDLEKRLYAENHGISVIRVISRKSELDYLKAQIIKSDLKELFDFSHIDWEKCAKKASKSLMVLACKLWEVYHDTRKISEQVGISMITANRYLRKGAKIGLCSYNGEDVRTEAARNKLYKKTKPVICLNNKKVFRSGTDAALFYCFPPVKTKRNNKIARSIRDKNGCCGVNPTTGEDLYWMYYEDWLKENPQYECKTAS